MSVNKVNAPGLAGLAGEGTWPGIDSRFRLIIVAGLRTKQLLHGSKPRVEADKMRRRHTSIAVEEVKRGLVPFTKSFKEKNIADEMLRPRVGRSESAVASGKNLPNWIDASIIT